MVRDGVSLPPLTLARSTVDRAAERRSEPNLLANLLADPATLVLPLLDGRAQVTEATPSGLELLLRPPAPEDLERLGVFLGVEAGGPAYVALVVDAQDQQDGWHSLREVGVDLGDRDAGLFTTALALANWHGAHRFCPRCGGPTTPVQAGWLRRCRNDGSDHYPRTDPAVIMAVVDEQDRLLLARGPDWAERRYSVLAGFVEPGETLAGAVAREVHEETGVHVTDVTFLGDQPWPFPSSLMLGFTARALDADFTLQDSEIAEARWVTKDQLREELAGGSTAISGRLSIARHLIEHWYGDRITTTP